MAAKDAEMPTHHALREEVEVIANNLSTLRKDIESLAAAIARAGGHQAERLEDEAGEALVAIEAAVRRNPAQAVGVALGVGLLLGLILRR
jgi:ElaB/YqjD/DUF883 family membrane-anchored ribosome-binding protein